MVQLMKVEWPKRLEYKSFYISVLFIHLFMLFKSYFMLMKFLLYNRIYL